MVTVFSNRMIDRFAYCSSSESIQTNLPGNIATGIITSGRHYSHIYICLNYFHLLWTYYIQLSFNYSIII